ncbi:S41 family peptidase [Cognatilysobacter bugurensis]|uniref:S41 family peptidase n=1 Tax=Cognatilysobacter bugurensis TaxID=543356 RepID=UPI0016737D50|nr:S41 family peptidase [Lysobacter bugurensis]
MDLTLKLARERAYRAAHVEWQSVEEEARSLASNQGEGAAIRFVLKSLGDGHSFYRPPRKAVMAPADANSAPRPPTRVLSQVEAPIEGVPVIRINGWSGTHQEAMAATEALRSQLVSTLSEPRCGVVLDFSGNSGGNMWPMLVGLSPLLSEGVLGHFKNARGTVTTIEKKTGGIFIGGSGHVLNGGTAQQPEHPVPLIAVAVGPRSSSSGEIVPIMFHGQENVRLFGQRTSGKSTANSTFPLPNGGAANITTAVTLDRHGRVFDAHIEPEASTARPLEDAARWISGECRRG